MGRGHDKATASPTGLRRPASRYLTAGNLFIRRHDGPRRRACGWLLQLYSGPRGHHPRQRWWVPGKNVALGIRPGAHNSPLCPRRTVDPSSERDGSLQFGAACSAVSPRPNPLAGLTDGGHAEIAQQIYLQREFHVLIGARGCQTALSGEARINPIEPACQRLCVDFTVVDAPTRGAAVRRTVDDVRNLSVVLVGHADGRLLHSGSPYPFRCHIHIVGGHNGAVGMPSVASRPAEIRQT